MEQVTGTDVRVLVVDDDDFVRGLLEEMLHSLGVTRISHARDGAAALRVVRDQQVDVAICDLSMPGMDGVELLRHLSTGANPPALVVISAESSTVLETAAMLAEARGLRLLGVLPKPVTAGDLALALERHQTMIAHRGELPVPGGAGDLSPVLPLEVREIADGIRDGAVVPYFQPAVDTAGRLVGAEALARWQVGGRALAAGMFLPVIERRGMIGELTRAMFRASLRAASAWDPAPDGRPLDLSVNVSVTDLEDMQFLEFVLDETERQGVAPERVTFEVIETKAMQRVPTALEIFTRLRLRGFGLSLDDYGVGTSTMEQLRRVPLTELKIDRQFVQGSAHDRGLQAMVRATVEMARALDLTIVAEGVETPEEFDRVVDLGVDRVQGYLFSEPLSDARFRGWRAPGLPS